MLVEPYPVNREASRTTPRGKIGSDRPSLVHKPRPMSIPAFSTQEIGSMRQSFPVWINRWPSGLELLSNLVFLGVSLFTAGWLAGQESPPGNPTSVRETTSDVSVAELCQYIEGARVAWQVPGLAVAIVKDDQVVLSRGFGVTQTGQTTAIDEHTLFAIASNSKAFTSAALAILVDEGKIRWDDPVRSYLPWLQLRDPLTRDLRVRDLLCHRSGLGTFSGDLLWWGTDYSPREVLERAAELEPAAPFRAAYGYSNLMFLAAGLVIEQVSGQAWSEFVGQRILQPLQMNRTITSVRDLLSQGNFATPHKTFLDRSEPLPWMNWDSMAAAGGIISSVHDMSRWLQVQLRHGQFSASDQSALRLFSAAQSHAMWQAHTPMTVSDAYQRRYPSTHFRAYGLGWSLSDYLGRKVVSHGGGYDGMYSQVVMVPEEKLGMVVLTNSMTSISASITFRILDSYLKGSPRDWSSEQLEEFKKSREAFDRRIQEVIQPVASNTRPSHVVSEYVARFRCPMYGDAVVDSEDGKLVLKLLPAQSLVADLEHLHFDTFVVRWRSESAWFGSGTAHFVANSRGKFTKLELDIPNDDLWFYELKFQRLD